MEHFGWNLGTAVTVCAVVDVLFGIALFGQPREPYGRAYLLMAFVWAMLCLLGLVGVMTW